MAALAKDSIINKPTLIEFKNLRFLIMDAPRQANLHLYLKECKKHNVVHIVRISEPSYGKEEVEAAGITLHVRFFYYLVFFLFYIILFLFIDLNY